METCEQIQSELSAYLDGELPPQERGAIDSHLGTCTACRAALDELGSVRSSLNELPKLKAPASLAAKIRRGIAESAVATAPHLLSAHSAQSARTIETLSFERPSRQTKSFWRPVLLSAVAMLMAGIIIFLALPQLSPATKTAQAPAPAVASERALSDRPEMTTPTVAARPQSAPEPAKHLNNASRIDALNDAKSATAEPAQDRAEPARVMTINQAAETPENKLGATPPATRKPADVTVASEPAPGVAEYAPKAGEFDKKSAAEENRPSAATPTTPALPIAPKAPGGPPHGAEAADSLRRGNLQMSSANNAEKEQALEEKPGNAAPARAKSEMADEADKPLEKMKKAGQSGNNAKQAQDRKRDAVSGGGGMGGGGDAGLGVEMLDGNKAFGSREKAKQKDVAAKGQGATSSPSDAPPPPPQAPAPAAAQPPAIAGAVAAPIAPQAEDAVDLKTKTDKTASSNEMPAPKAAPAKPAAKRAADIAEQKSGAWGADKAARLAGEASHDAVATLSCKPSELDALLKALQRTATDANATLAPVEQAAANATGALPHFDDGQFRRQEAQAQAQDDERLTRPVQQKSGTRTSRVYTLTVSAAQKDAVMARLQALKTVAADQGKVAGKAIAEADAPPAELREKSASSADKDARSLGQKEGNAGEPQGQASGGSGMGESNSRADKQLLASRMAATVVIEIRIEITATDE